MAHPSFIIRELASQISASFLANISVKSPRKLFISIIQINVFRIKVSKKHFDIFWIQKHCRRSVPIRDTIRRTGVILHFCDSQLLMVMTKKHPLGYALSRASKNLQRGRFEGDPPSTGSRRRGWNLLSFHKQWVCVTLLVRLLLHGKELPLAAKYGYRHPENYLFLLSKHIFFGSKYPDKHLNEIWKKLHEFHGKELQLAA